jgi:hypothetical protein
MKRLLPAYPLFVKDPYFSVWSAGDVLNSVNTSFWTGLERPVYGIVWADGTSYAFLGSLPDCLPLRQTSIGVSSFTTDYTFECDLFSLRISFVSPLLPDDCELLSCPVCYLNYEIMPHRPIGDLKISLVFDEKNCYNKPPENLNGVLGGSFALEKYEVAYFGLNRQLPMSHTGDSVAADWGYTYIAAQSAVFTSESGFSLLKRCGGPGYTMKDAERKYLIGTDCYTGVSSQVRGKILVAFDDVCSIFYFGEFLKGYYFRNGKTIFDALEDAFDSHEAVMTRLSRFDSDLKEKAAEFGEDYLLLLYASLRQTMAAHKLVENGKGQLLFLSKECHSNGCIATVDVSYPSMPLFLLYNPKLLEGMLYPIFEFARRPVWKYDFAPHDAGTYPYCIGQTYGLSSVNAGEDRFLANSIRRKWRNEEILTHPLFYTFPKECGLYKYDGQMPLEECSNMLIMVAALLLRGEGRALAEENFDRLKTWYGYLSRKGLVPESQLCTDDFAKRVDKNINLSIKSMTGIYAFSLICSRLGYREDADRAAARAYELVGEFKAYLSDNDYSHIPLSYGSGSETFSLKYNFAIDALLGTELFDSRLFEREIDCYLSKLDKYGVSLDNRSSITKSDWQLYACLLTKDLNRRKKIYSAVARYLRESDSRVPFGDLYFADTGLAKDFQNRSVQGGIFILLLDKEGLMRVRGLEVEDREGVTV